VDSVRWARADAAEAVLERRWAERLGIRVGERIRFTVAGEDLEAEVVGLRRVDWMSFRLNFFIHLSPAVTAGMPRAWFGNVVGGDAAACARLRDALAAGSPNVAMIEVAEAAARVRALLGVLSVAVAAVAVFTLAAGLVVLAGLALASARPRAADAALLAALGAGRGVLVRSLAAEFGALALLGAGLGLGLGAASSWLVVRELAGLPLAIPWAHLAVLGAGIATLAAGVGVVACHRVLHQPPLAVLREG
jgi:putative ABC transport system permease protein